MSANISKIKSSDGTTYDLKDALARTAIDELTKKITLIYSSLSSAFCTKDDYKDVAVETVLSALNNIVVSANAISE